MLNVRADFNLSISLAGDNSDDAKAELGVATDSVSLSEGVALAHGTGANQCDIMFHDRVSITGSTELVFDDVSLTDAFGTGLDIAKLKVLWIKNSTGGEVTIGASVAEQMAIFGTPATDTLLIKDGGEFLWIAPDSTGLVITGAGTLKIAHDAGGAQNVDIIVAGVQA